MKKTNKNIYLLIGTVVLFVLIHVLSPRQFNWFPSFSAKDKNQFGAYVLNSLLPDLFPGQTISHNNITFYESADSLLAGRNIMALSTNMILEAEDTRTLLNHVDSGANAFLSATYFSGLFSDTLGLETKDVLLNLNVDDLSALQDSSYLQFSYGKSER